MDTSSKLLVLVFLPLLFQERFVISKPTFQYVEIKECPSWDVFLFGGCLNTTDVVTEIVSLLKTSVNYSLADAVPSDVQYRLIRDANDAGILLDETAVTTIDLDKNLPTKLLIHGWTTNEKSVWYEPMKNAYLKKDKQNIFYIDWSKAGNKSYLVSSANTKPIGGFIADFLIASGISLDKIHVIGHSLGSHVAGFIGKSIYEKTNMTIGRITATDPAFPLFEHEEVDATERLSKTDASFVDIIHTDAGHFGFTSAIGHVDFYPNGGKLLQPGCPPLTEDDNCSHAKSNVYLIKSINMTDIFATECATWEAYQNGECRNNNKILFGENVNTNSEGVYYLEIEADLNDYS